jgi:hypothetical protein
MGSTFGLINVKDYGAKGDGAADDIVAITKAVAAAFGPANYPNGGYDGPSQGHAGLYANVTLFFPPGTYNISKPIQLIQVGGARITGAGRRATRIVNTASSGTNSEGDVFNTDGFQYSCLENMTLVSPTWASSVNHCFDFALSGNINLQVETHGIMFKNIRFEGGDWGAGLGNGGMGSEVAFLGCDFVSCNIGIEAFNQNALDFNVLGCKFTNCGKAIKCNDGNFYVAGCSFSGSTTYDLQSSGSFSWVIEGCGSTSSPVSTYNVANSVHFKSFYYHPTAAPPNSFCVIQQSLLMDGCVATNCVLADSSVAVSGGLLYFRGNVLPGTFVSGSGGSPTFKENI